jgi:hypothetical protein
MGVTNPNDNPEISPPLGRDPNRRDSNPNRQGKTQMPEPINIIAKRKGIRSVDFVTAVRNDQIACGRQMASDDPFLLPPPPPPPQNKQRNFRR